MTLAELLAQRAAIEAQIAEATKLLTDVCEPAYQQLQSLHVQIKAAIPTANVDELLALRFKTDAAVKLAEASAGEKVKQLKDELAAVEAHARKVLEDTKQTQLKTTAGSCFFITKDSVTVRDMSLVIDFMLSFATQPADVDEAAWARSLLAIRTMALWSILNNDVNKTAVKEIMASGVQPPGIAYSAFKGLAWRRA